MCHVIADQLFHAEHVLSTGTLSRRRLRIHSLQFFQAFLLTPPGVTPFTAVGMSHFLYNTLEQDPTPSSGANYFSTSMCIAKIHQRTVRYPNSNGLMVPSTCVLWTLVCRGWMLDGFNKYSIRMSSAHLEVFAKATKPRIVLLTFWQSSRHFTYLDIDWKTGFREP